MKALDSDVSLVWRSARLSVDKVHSVENAPTNGVQPKRAGSLFTCFEYPMSRSPLRYPGGKSRAVRSILKYIPSDITSLCSPFLGGGSIELAVSSLGIPVYGYDVFNPLVIFWQELIKDSQGLADKVRGFWPLAKSAFYELQKGHQNIVNRKEAAAAYYVLNRSSYSGTTLSGGMSPGHPRFTLSAIERLRAFCIRDFNVECLDFEYSINKHSDGFLYLDPPYANGQALYGDRGNTHKDFDHEKLAKLLRKRGRWVLSYNDCDYVRKLYSDYRIVNLDWTYGMGNSKKSKEVLVISNDL